MFRQVNSKFVFSVILQSVLVLSFLTACQKDDNTKKLRASRTQQGKPTDPKKSADPSKPADAQNGQTTSQDGQKSEIKANLGFEKIEEIKNEKIKSTAASVVAIEVGSGDTHQGFTGFISNDGAQVITALSNLVDVLKEELKTSSDDKIKEVLDAGNIKIKMAISDHSKKVLITNTDEVKIAKLSKEQKEYLTAILKSEEAVLADQDNVVRLSLDKKIGSALKLVESKENEKVYIAGYSEKTTDRTELKAKDADGESLVISSGTLIDLKEALISVEEKISEESLQEASVSMLASNADSTSSMVGSPILNEQGEVVGILLRSSNDLKTKRSFGLSTNSF